MKIKTIHILLTIFLLFSYKQVTFAATCDLGVSGWINGAWSVPGNCDFPVGPHLINGDITVGNNTVTIPNNSMIVIDLSVRKITFNLGKILLQGNAVIKYVRSSTFYNGTDNNSSSDSSRTDCNVAGICTACPSGKSAILKDSLSLAPSSLTYNNAPPISGRVYCQ